MSVRSSAAVALAVSFGFAAPAFAEHAPRHPAKPAIRSVALKASAAHGIDPARVLAGGAKPGFADRSANLASIMGPETGARMQIPLRPEHPRSLRREADATAGLR